MTTSVVLLVAGWVAGWWLLWRVPDLPPSPGTADHTDPYRSDAGCAVVIPVRDEADNIVPLLATLARQSPPAREVVVVDDGSRDETIARARGAGARVIEGSPPPGGWAGKPWACQQGADATTAPRLVFLDADVRLADGGLARVLGVHDRAGGLVSVAPYHRMRGAIERLSAVFNVVAFMGVGAARPGMRGRSDGAFGPCMVCWRDDYRDVGGHRAAHDVVTEDLAIARAFDRAGLPTFVFAGREVVEYRMYPAGIQQLVEGWSKNIASGARFVSAARSLLIALWITGLLIVTQSAVAAVVYTSTGHAVIAGAGYAAYVVQHRVFLAALGNAGWLTASSFPLTTIFFVLIFLRSLWLTFVRRRVRWRGRDLAVGGRASPPSALREG